MLGYSRTVWTLLIGTLLFGMAYYMTWPFLAIVLKRDYGMATETIGLVLTIAALMGAVASQVAGYLADRFGRRRVITISQVSVVSGFCLMASASSVAMVILGAFCVVIARHLQEPANRALLSDLNPDDQRRERVFHLSYFLVNIGGASGPMLALWFGFTAQQQGFWVSAAVLGAYSLVLLTQLARMPASEKSPVTTLNWRQTAKVLIDDRALRWLILGSVFIAYTFAHQDSTLVQYLTHYLTYEQAAWIFGFTIAGNSLVVVLLQFPLLHWLRHLDVSKRIQLGVLGFCGGFMTYALTPVGFVWGYLLGTLILSVGEAILFPTLNVRIDQLAPKTLKASYFGANNLYALGYGVGPLLGGAMIAASWGVGLWWSTALVTLLALFCYRASAQLR